MNNIIEVSKEENLGKKYEAYYNGKSSGIWRLEKKFGDIFELYDENGSGITDLYYVSEIASLEFKEVIDWSEMPVDTKVLVSKDGKKWLRRHFAKYEDGKVYCFNGGYTSFTIVNYGYLSNAVIWKYAKLYQE